MQGKSVVNSISLKEGRGKLSQTGPPAAALRRCGSGDGVRRKGQADTYQRKIDLPARTGCWSIPSASPLGTSSSTPTCFALATGLEEHNNYGVDFIEAVRWIPESAGRQNVRRHLEHVVQLPRQRSCSRGHTHGFPLPRDQGGLTMGIVNAGQIGIYDELEPALREHCEDVILNRRADATERMLAFAETVKGGGKARWKTSAGVSCR